MDSRKLRYSLMMLAALVAFGTIGYYFFEHMPIFDSFYMVFNPVPSEKLEAGDVIVVIGQKEDLKRMRAVL
jgi:hypothetical protein